MQNFSQDLKNSVYGPQYYKDLQQKPFSYSLRYCALFGLLITLLATAALSIIYLPGIKTVANKAVAQLIEFYPAELQILIKDDQVSTNVSEPYFIKTPTGLPAPAGFSAEKTRIENFIVIDTQTPFTFDKFREYKAFVWLTKDAVAFLDNSSGSLSGVRYLPLENTPDFILTKDVAQTFWEKIQPLLDRWLNLIIPVVALMMIFWQVWLLIYLLLFALVIKLIVGASIDYKKAYQLGLHLFTPAILLVLLFKVVGLIAPLLFTISAVIFALLNLKSKRIEAAPAQ